MPETPHDIDEAIERLGDTPDTNEVFHGTILRSEREVASAAVSLAKAGGGGLPSEWTVGDAGDLIIAPSDDTLDALVTVTAPDDLLGNTSGDGALLKLIDQNGVVLAEWDVYGNYTRRVPSGQLGTLDFQGVDGGGLLLHVGTGTTELGVDTDNLGFFGVTPVAQQNVPLTSPTVQDIIDALVALGFVEQSD